MLLTLAEVEALTRVKKSTIYRLMKKGLFPQKRKILGTTKTGWLSSEVHLHIIKSPEFYTPAK